jgi:hypothetical protein
MTVADRAHEIRQAIFRPRLKLALYQTAPRSTQSRQLLAGEEGLDP